MPYISDGVRQPSLEPKITEPTNELALHYNFITNTNLQAELTTETVGPTLTFTRSGIATRVNPLGLIEDVAVDLPRFNFFPTTLQPRGLLVEKAMTNIALQNEELGTAPWTSMGAPTLTANDAIDPRGNMGAMLINDTSVTVSEGVQQEITVPDDTEWRTFSIFVKKTTGGTSPIFGMDVQFVGGTPSTKRQWRLNTDTGGMTGQSHQGADDFGDYWRMMGINNNSGGGNTTLRVQLFPAAQVHNENGSHDPGEAAEPGEAATDDDVAAIGSAHAWGLNVMTQSTAVTFARSHIPTTTVPVTRGADLVFTTDMSWLNAGGEHTLYTEHTHEAPMGDQGLMQISDGTNGDVIGMEALFPPGLGFFVGATEIGTLSQENSQGINRAAFALKAGDQYANVNGGTAITGTVTGAGFPAAGDMTALHIGNRPGGLDAYDGHIREIRYYNVRKSDQFVDDLTKGLDPIVIRCLFPLV